MEDYEQTLLVLKECFVYRIPPRATATGYRAADWDLPNPIWKGRLTISSVGSKCSVKLEDPSTGETFANCAVNDTAVEPVNDSSRYFVLRIEDAGRHAFIGMGFAERSDAFDFSAALQDHKKFVKQSKEAENAAQNLSSVPHQDYSLKEGEKIHVSIKTTKKSEKVVTGASSGGGGLGFLPPPPGSRRAAPSQTQQQQPSGDFWGDFKGDSSSTPSTSSAPSDWNAFQ